MRRAAVRPWLLALVPAALVLAALAARPRWSPRPEPVCSTEIASPNPGIMARLEYKTRVVDELIAGRRGLLEAAAAFRSLDADGRRPAALLVFPEATGDSEEELYCRSVVAWARARMPGQQGEALARQLEAELTGRLKDGALRLAS